MDKVQISGNYVFLICLGRGPHLEPGLPSEFMSYLAHSGVNYAVATALALWPLPPFVAVGMLLIVSKHELHVLTSVNARLSISLLGRIDREFV